MILNPLAGVLTSSYDVARWHPTLKRPVPHLGSDLGGRPRGVVHWVGAAAAGRVLYVRSDSYAGDRRGGYLPRLTGNQVVLEHADRDGRTFRTYYGHLSRVVVVKGQHVRAGQRLGTMGATGDTAGAHLHLEVWIDGQPVDPAPFFESAGAPLGAGPTKTPVEDIMGTLDDDDLAAIAAAVWGHRLAGSNRPAGEVIDKTNHAAGRTEGALRALEVPSADDIAGAVWAAPVGTSGRPAGDVIDKTNHAAGRLETLRGVPND